MLLAPLDREVEHVPLSCGVRVVRRADGGADGGERAFASDVWQARAAISDLAAALAKNDEECCAHREARPHSSCCKPGQCQD